MKFRPPDERELSKTLERSPETEPETEKTRIRYSRSRPAILPLRYKIYSLQNSGKGEYIPVNYLRFFSWPGIRAERKESH
jgi:hypothetical protein